MSNLIDLIFSNRPNISLLSIKGENLITWWWSAQNSYMQARVTYLSGKSFLCEVWNTFIFLKKKKINYHILYKYFLLPSWCLHNYADLAPPFFFENLFFFLYLVTSRFLNCPILVFLTEFVECRNNDRESFNFSTVANLWGEIISRDNLSHQT